MTNGGNDQPRDQRTGRWVDGDGHANGDADLPDEHTGVVGGAGEVARQTRSLEDAYGEDYGELIALSNHPLYADVYREFTGSSNRRRRFPPVEGTMLTRAQYRGVARQSLTDAVDANLRANGVEDRHVREKVAARFADWFDRTYPK